MNKLMIKLITSYQKTKVRSNRVCKYTPSCSEYAKEAFRSYGFLKAFFLSLFRLLRCNPFSKGGYDPLPIDKHLRKQTFDATVYIIKKRRHFIKK